MKHLKIENIDSASTMNKLDLIRTIADNLNLPQKDVKAIVNEFLTQIVNAVATGDKVSLQNFGSFEAIERKTREGRNPRTGEPIEIPSKKLPSFHAGREFKDRVNQ